MYIKLYRLFIVNKNCWQHKLFIVLTLFAGNTKEVNMCSVEIKYFSNILNLRGLESKNTDASGKQEQQCVDIEM